ncbi:MAG: ATP-binding protein, partial [Nocardioides sp.]
GLHPATLDAGLGSALQEVAARAPLPVRVRAARERFSSEAEATAYFIACEGLTNALKHSGAQQVEITAERDEDDLVITVADDGRGGAHLGAGNGLISLRDRARARGGTLLVDSPGGRGTRLVARFPCG